MTKGIKIGDYVHASRWSDKDPNDPWSIGHVKEIRITKTDTYYKLEGPGVLDRWFPHAKKISIEEGYELCKSLKETV